jgi:predicted  nucleic acid-binding Zn-ribbon protein
MIVHPLPKEETVCYWPNAKVVSLQSELKIANDTIVNLRKDLEAVSSKVDVTSQEVIDIKDQIKDLPTKEITVE